MTAVTIKTRREVARRAAAFAGAVYLSAALTAKACGDPVPTLA
jgi:hypothetical protein